MSCALNCWNNDAMGRLLPGALSDPPPGGALLPVQVRFFEVSESELEDLRERFRSGQYSINIEAKTFSMAEYNDLLGSELCQEICRTFMEQEAAIACCRWSW